jgi:hypothetical protein
MLNSILNTIDPDCLSFLQSGGQNLNSYVADLLKYNLLAVGTFSGSLNMAAAITGTLGTNLDADAAAIVINNSGAFFHGGLTVDNGQISGGTAKADVFILLHELGHALSAKGFQQDGPNAANPGAGSDNDKLIDKNCSKTLNQFK